MLSVLLLARPPKPSEPTGLGAVVEDDEGDSIVRVLSGRQSEPWFGPDGERYEWVDINVVRVLSEGVSPHE